MERTGRSTRILYPIASSPASSRRAGSNLVFLAKHHFVCLELRVAGKYDAADDVTTSQQAPTYARSDYCPDARKPSHVDRTTYY
mmetsp:Transcript_12974/g.30672  ORF Transcript_12974/g.30672 Transcript_12974/m.30672 type:complete len:84 (+) Transcript_12974:1528-1779(+)